MTEKPRGLGHLEFDVQAIGHLAQAVWLIGQQLTEKGQEPFGEPLVQLAEEIQRYAGLLDTAHDEIRGGVS
jgi:hypothetical protein